ncbi:MAG: glucosyl-3-phosphoglycerate synthase [Anaerolineae bacterium]|nr:glucosyl-3-phosphoglycerate synthase [Anaerolineae bacterium]
MAEGKPQVRYRARVRVTHSPWQEVAAVAQEERPDLLLLDYPSCFEVLGLSLQDVMDSLPCDVALARGPIPAHPHKVLVTARGGPFAELAMRLALSVTDTHGELSTLHVRSTQGSDLSFRGIAQVLANLPQVQRKEVVTDEAVSAILQAAQEADLVVMGATGQPVSQPDSLGPVTDRVLQETHVGVLVVKTRQAMPPDIATNVTVGQMAISILVDKWFAENTFHADEFADREYLLELKRQQGLTISLALPALNEEETVGRIIETIRRPLMDEIPLIDEMVLMDSDSSDRTREIAESYGLPIHIHQHTLPRYGARRGKGEALWKSLYCTRGDIVLWIDTDIANIHPRFVYGLIGPFLLNRHLQFIKGFYRRPLRVGDRIQAGGGGRVTELTARPLLNLFYPELSGVVQPLSGEYGGRRKALEQVPFFSGYGVEIGMLIDMFEKFGLSAIAQVDLQERVHHNQSLESLSKMSFAIIQAVITKLERRYGQVLLDDLNRTMKLIRYEGGLFLDVEEIAERERPPMIELPEYCTLWK